MITSTPRVTLVALALAVAAPAPAQPEAQGAKLLDQWKSLESASHKARIRILQEAEACLQGAHTLQAVRHCERKEQREREALREEQRPQREAFREQVKALPGHLAGDRAGGRFGD